METAQILQKLKSKKVIAVGVATIVVIALYLAQVFYMGGVNQRFYENTQKTAKEVIGELAKIDEAYGHFSIANETFERGFFSSEASFDILLDAAGLVGGGVGEIPPITVKIELKNNIFSSQNYTARLENPFHEMLSMLASASGITVNMDKNLIVAKANISLFGGASLEMRINDITLKASDNELMEFKDFVTMFKIDGDGKLTSSSLHFGGFEIRNKNEAYYMKEVVSNTKFNEPVDFFGAIGFKLVDYDSHTSIKSMGFKDFGNGVEILETTFDIKAQASDDKNSSNSGESETFNFNTTTKIKNLNRNENDSKIALNDINAQILIKEIPVKVYYQLLVAMYDTKEILAMLDNASSQMEISDISFRKDNNDFKANGFIKKIKGDAEVEVNLLLTSNVHFSELLPGFLADIELIQNNEGRYVLEIVGMGEDMRFNGKSFVEFAGIDDGLIDDEQPEHIEAIELPEDTQIPDEINPTQPLRNP
ncbi:DUF945 family protein [Helicobacter sp. 23-1046]